MKDCKVSRIVGIFWWIRNKDREKLGDWFKMKWLVDDIENDWYLVILEYIKFYEGFFSI